MKKFLSAILSVFLLIAVLAPCCGAQGTSFQIGELTFEAPEGAETMCIGVNAYAVTISQNAAWAVLYATDVSAEESQSGVQAVTENQLDFWGTGYREQVQNTLSASGFSISFRIYTAPESEGNASYRMVGTFTDTWYVYTFLLTASDSQYQDAFTQMITGAQHSGKAVRFDAESAEAETTAAQTYVLNTNTMKFHYPDCSSVDKIKAANRQDTTASRDELIAKGYSPCGRCCP